ncbi:hypothetical protein JW962_00775 [Candidatus Dojkabacteria bacterium]|nr:hypothetical protein [Candidatus Dojkabacteria bacterium]
MSPEQILTKILNMRIENFLVLFWGVLSVVIAIYVGIKGKSRVSSLLYAFISTITGPLWSIAIAFFRESTDIPTALFWDQIIYLVSILIAPLFYTFSTFFPREKKFPITMMLVSVLGFSYFLYEIYFGKNFIAEIILNDNGNTIRIGYAYVIWFVWFVLLMGLGQLRILKEFFSLKGTEREQVKYLTWGILLPALGTIPTNALFPLWGEYRFIWIGPYFMIAMHIVVTYGITRARFRNISSVIGAILRFFCGFLYLIGAFTIINYLYIYLFSNGFSEIFIPVVFGVGVILGAPAIYLFKIIDQLIDSSLQGTQNLDELMDLLFRKIQTELSILKLTNLIASYLSEIFKATGSGIMIINNETKEVEHEAFSGFDDLSTEKLIPLASFWDEIYEKGEPIILSELEYIIKLGLSLPRSKSAQKVIEIIDFMSKHNIEVIIPLSEKLNLSGLIILSRKKGDAPYWVEDIKNLKLLTERISLSVSRALLYDQINDFNRTLQTRVTKATQKVKDKNKILRENLRRERDLIDIMGHELRTPLTIIRNCFDLVLVNMRAKNTKGVLTWVEKGIAGTKRGIDILESMLTTTKIDKNKIQVVMEKVSLSELAKSVVDGLTKEASIKGLEFKSQVEDRIFVYADTDKVLQIINNLVNNAIKYTDAGYIRLLIERRGDNVILEVSDTGVGISKEDIKNLGKKFFRSNPYIGKEEGVSEIVRPGGTGLGLYVVFNYVKYLNGDISVKSGLGKGTTFTVTLPVFEGQKTKSSKGFSTDKFEKLKKEV